MSEEGQKYMDLLAGRIGVPETSSRRVVSPLKSAINHEDAAKTSTIMIDDNFSANFVKYLDLLKSYADKHGLCDSKYLGKDGKLLIPPVETRLKLVRKAGLWDYFVKIKLWMQKSQAFIKQEDRANRLLDLEDHAFKKESKKGLTVKVSGQGKPTRLHTKSEIRE